MEILEFVSFAVQQNELLNRKHVAAKSLCPFRDG